MERLQRELEKVLDKDQILQKEPLARHTSFRIGGPADWYLRPDAGQLLSVLNILSKYQVPASILGNGSNVLAGDLGIRGAVIEIGRRMSKITVKDAVKDSGESGVLTAEAGALLSQAAQAALQNGLGGLEFAAGIPGSVGGAMVMNAGAYGGEMKDVVDEVEVLDHGGNIQRLTNAQMEFAYRRSCILQNGFFVLKASFRLKRSDPKNISARMEELKEQRRRKQPLEFPSAGSTFKRPEGHFAGKLIMDAGLSGFSIGGAEVSKKHCGFVINRGGATAADVLAVIAHVQKTVREQFGVELSPEIKIIGEI